MRGDIENEIQTFLDGFYEIIPYKIIYYFHPKELQILISGIKIIQVDDMKKNVTYSGYKQSDQIISQFWQILEYYSQQVLAKLIRFITSSNKIPAGRFSEMTDINGRKLISIHQTPNLKHLPKSQTCFNQFILPSYTSKELLQKNLRTCLKWGTEGFGIN